MSIAALLLMLCIWIGPALAEPPPALALPLACAPGQSCWILRYVDHDPGPGALDYRCGTLTGDDHHGTDFAIRDFAEVTRGVAVLAAAAGRVVAVRDGMPDVEFTPDDQAAVGGRECGNGVRLDHGDGWSTLYCHLRRGSHLIAEGDDVVAGQSLGLVGLSGRTSFPHVHFEVRYNDQAIDPFQGTTEDQRCGQRVAPLWKSSIVPLFDQEAPFLTNIGIAPASPARDDVRQGWHRASVLPTTSPALVLWVDGYWFQDGDKITFTLDGPQGNVVKRRFEVNSPRQSWFSFAGAPRPAGGWSPGVYRGEVTVQRQGRMSDVVLSHDVELR